MTPQIPFYLTVFEGALRVVVVASAVGLLLIGAARLKGSSKSRFGTASVVSLIIFLWWVLAQYLGARNAYFVTSNTAVSPVIFGLTIPLAIAAIGIWRSKNVARLIEAIPSHWLVAAQAWRVGGVIFLILWADGRLPWQFALPAGIGDVVAGLLAVPVARMIARQAPGASRAAYTWSLFGVGDLAVAITMGTLTSPGRMHLLSLDAPNLLITSDPLVMVPTFAVPVALILHGIVLGRLSRSTALVDQFAAG